MSAEDLINIDAYIETEDSEERGKILEGRIDQISLVYADKKFQEMKKENPEYKFSDAIKSFTPIHGNLESKLGRLKDFSFKKNKEKLSTFFKDFYDSIDLVYEAEGLNMTKVMDIIRKAEDSLMEYFDVVGVEKREQRKEILETQLLTVNYVHDITGDGRYLGLLERGFSSSDHLLEMHVKSFYKVDKEELSPELIKNDLALMAEHIVDKVPETRAVVGTSWLSSTPMLARLGFTKLEDGKEDEKREEKDPSTWSQFIDKDGQINKKRFKTFYETGDMPFRSVAAYIPVEEFLRRYLPKDRKGKIILKEKDRDIEYLFNKAKGLAKIAKTSWADLLINKSIEDVIPELNSEHREKLFVDFINNPDIQDFIEEFGTDNRQLIIGFLREMYDKKIPWEEFQKHQSDEFKEAASNVEKGYLDRMYVDREVDIQ